MEYSVYCIALDSRQAHAEKFVASLGYDRVIFPPVVLADTLDRQRLLKNGIVSEIFPDSKEFRGKVACGMSHAKALRLFLESNQPLALIFEDDNEIPVDPRETRERVDALARTTGWSVQCRFAAGESVQRRGNTICVMGCYYIIVSVTAAIR